ncbi:hypothetical protein ACVWZK_003254 [Bradyrhizobium sp. GM0.4]
MLDLLVDRAGDKDLAWLGDALDTRGDIDAVAVDVVRLHDDVTEIDANPVLDPGVLRKRGVAADEILLDDDAASDGLDRTVENRDEAIARRLHQTSVVLDDAGLDEIPLDPLDADVRALFVGLHQAAVGSDVTDNDGREATRHRAVRRRLVIPGSEVANFAHCGDSTNLQRQTPAYDCQRRSSVKAITSMESGNVRGIAGAEFRKAKASRRMNLQDPTDD